jgi:hypothetical protein
MVVVTSSGVSCDVVDRAWVIVAVVVLVGEVVVAVVVLVDVVVVTGSASVGLTVLKIRVAAVVGVVVGIVVGRGTRVAVTYVTCWLHTVIEEE